MGKKSETNYKNKYKKSENKNEGGNKEKKY